MTVTEPFGSWRSPITPETFSKGNCKAICELQATKDGVFWVEQSASTGKRELYFQAKNGSERIRWAPEQSVQNCVHEYGGGSFMPTEDGVVYSTVEGLYEQKTSGSMPVQLANAAERTFRFADFSLSPSSIFCVNESHQVKGEDPTNRLISIDKRTSNQQVVASGADFYACPRVSPDGKRVVWMQWNHINMPWDETSIYLADVNSEDGTVSNTKRIRCGVGKNINYYNPMWSPENELYLIHDATNFWNLYKIDLTNDSETNVYPAEKEIGYPLWQFSDRPCAISRHGIVLRVGEELVLKTTTGCSVLSTPGYKSFSHLSITDEGTVYAIAAGPSKSSSLLRIDPDQSVRVIRESRDQAELASYDVSEPEALKYKSDGVDITGFFYPPKNREYEGPAGALPPVILLGHGGPTSCAYSILDMKKQFFTSRGFAVFDVDYRGSTSYGSGFRHMLKRNWGVVDRDDMINGAKFLIETGRVDPDKVCIMGSSAGGYLLLSALTHSSVFKAAVSIYGVADLVGMAKDTHKFEKGYNEALVGKYPEEAKIYEERSPINQIDKLTTPTAFLHGREDTVVPFSQSVEMYEKLRAKGVTTALQLYENEGHGFRGAEAVRRSNEASYYFLCKVLDIKPSIESDLEIVNLKSHI